jgi:hypothetical protein
MKITVKKKYGRLVPQFLRDMFRELQPFDDGWPAGLMDEEEPFRREDQNEIWARMDANQRALWLTSQLYNDAGIMPWGTCEDWNLPQGSTYGLGARVARKDLKK